jgi:hypothetical protein
MKTYSQFIAEAEKQLKYYTLYHGTSPEGKKSIQNTGLKKSPDGAYGSGVYSSTNRRISNVHGDSTITMKVPAKKINTKDVKSGTDALDKDNSVVRIPNAGTRTSAYRNLKGKKDFVVLDQDVANKHIVKNPSPTVKSGKEKRKKIQPKKK